MISDELNLRERRMIWALTNSMQNSCLRSFAKDIELLSKMDNNEPGGARGEAWFKETLDDWDMLQMIKAKMNLVGDDEK